MGVETVQKRFCCRNGERFFSANAAAIASVTLLVISASCFLASFAISLSWQHDKPNRSLPHLDYLPRHTHHTYTLRTSFTFTLETTTNPTTTRMRRTRTKSATLPVVMKRKKNKDTSFFFQLATFLFVFFMFFFSLKCIISS